MTKYDILDLFNSKKKLQNLKNNIEYEFALMKLFCEQNIYF